MTLRRTALAAGPSSRWASPPSEVVRGDVKAEGAEETARDRPAIDSRFAYAIIGLLGAASVICVALVGARMVYSESGHYSFLVWNLALAWVPFVFAGLAWRMARGRRTILSAFVVAAALVWLLFFPNAPYILTDFLHLGSMGDMVPGWYDVLMLFWFAWTGLMLGVVSLYLMQDVVMRAAGGAVGWLFVVVAAALGSFGIYLGRFLRWNSWDLLRRPRPLAAELYGTVTDPAAQPQLLLFTLLFALFFLFVYVAVSVFARLVAPHSDRVSRS